MADTKKKVSQNKKLLPFQENLKKTAEAISKLEAAGYQLLGSPSGTVTVLELTKTKTLKSGHVVHDYVPVWRGKSYVDAVNELIKPADSTNKTATKPKKTTTARGAHGLYTPPNSNGKKSPIVIPSKRPTKTGAKGKK